MALQQELSSDSQGRDLQVRIGIHLGDVVDKGGDLFGTAVNVAARLEGIAQPGGIVVSAAVRDAIAGKLAASFADLGLKTLKNIEEPLRAYALSPRAGSLSPGASRAAEALPLPNKPSIAVLPFDEPEWRPRPRVLRGWHGRGDHHRAVAYALALRHRKELELRLQGSGR